MQFLSAFAVLCGLVIAVVAAPTSLEVDAKCAVPPTSPKYCDGVDGKDGSVYLCGDKRLGPKDLPKGPPFDLILQDYNRLGGLCPNKFLEKWTSAEKYVYPPGPTSGFLLNDIDQTINATVELPKGTRIDRFGNPTGKFFSPTGTLFEERAIPPSNLDTYDPTHPNGYYVYEVQKPFQVSAGPIAPWFGQPGLGLQFDTEYVTGLGADQLVQKGFLCILKDGKCQ